MSDESSLGSWNVQVLERLVRMETKIDYLSDRSSRNELRLDQLERSSGPNPDHESRIRALEQFRWRLAGIAMGIGAVSGGVIGALANLLIG